MPPRRRPHTPQIPVVLTQVVTTDGVILSGVMVAPRGRKKTALLWLHGLTSSFDNGQPLMNVLSRTCRQQGIGYCKFNTRGHHVADYGNYKTHDLVGAGFERFSDCLKDIDAIIAHIRHLGYRHIILAGHSTGANKVLFYMYRRRPSAVRGVLLAGPVSDIVSESSRIGRNRLAARVRRASVLARRKIVPMVPTSWGFMSAARYVSLFKPGEFEDVFPWHNQRAGWKELTSVRRPVLVVFGEHDEALDRPARDVVRLFQLHARHCKKFTGAVIAQSGHGFYQHERQLTDVIARWLQSIV